MDIKKFFLGKISRKIMLGYLAIAFLILAVNVSFFVTSKQAIQDEIGDNSINLAQSRIEEIEKTAQYSTELLKTYMENSVVNNLLTDKPPEDINSNSLSLYLKDFTKNSKFSEVIVVNKEGMLIAQSHPVNEQILSEEGIVYKDGNVEITITLEKGSVKGNIKIEDIIEKEGLLNLRLLNDGELVYQLHEEKEVPQITGFYVKGDNIHSEAESDSLQLQMEQERPLSYLTSRSRVILSISIFLTIVVILFGSMIAKNISNPISKLKEATEEMQHGNFRWKVNLFTGDELEKLANAFNQTNEALNSLDEQHKQIDQAKTRFLSITSHELRSPMTPMKAQLQMLLQGYYGKLNAKQKESVSMVVRNAERLDKIIVDFLEVSRIEAARLKFHFENVDLKNTTKELIEYMKGFMPEKKIKLVMKIEQLPIIEADPDRVMQVLRNLINNAIKFTPENGTVEISGRLENKMIRFSVQDSGIGISQNDQESIFEPFFQAEQTMYRKKGGTGLGLAICKGIVESQNGRMWVDSKVGKGTKFSFTVPLKPVKEIKPIKVLFSSQDVAMSKIKKIFTTYLGPLGENEYNEAVSKGIKLSEIEKHLNKLKKMGILRNHEFNAMQNEISDALKPKNEVRNLCIKALGPYGQKEFDKIKNPTKNKLYKLSTTLQKKGLLNEVEAQDFIQRVDALQERGELK